MSTNHGGSRPGAGRPPVEHPRVKLQARVHPDTLKRMDKERAKRGMCLGRFLDWLMEPLR